MTSLMQAVCGPHDAEDEDQDVDPDSLGDHSPDANQWSSFAQGQRSVSFYVDLEADERRHHILAAAQRQYRPHSSKPKSGAMRPLSAGGVSFFVEWTDATNAAPDQASPDAGRPALRREKTFDLGPKGVLSTAPTPPADPTSFTAAPRAAPRTSHFSPATAELTTSLVEAFRRHKLSSGTCAVTAQLQPERSAPSAVRPTPAPRKCWDLQKPIRPSRKRDSDLTDCESLEAIDAQSKSIQTEELAVKKDEAVQVRDRPQAYYLTCGADVPAARSAELTGRMVDLETDTLPPGENLQEALRRRRPDYLANTRMRQQERMVRSMTVTTRRGSSPTPQKSCKELASQADPVPTPRSRVPRPISALPASMSSSWCGRPGSAGNLNPHPNCQRKSIRPRSSTTTTITTTTMSGSPKVRCSLRKMSTASRSKLPVR